MAKTLVTKSGVRRVTLFDVDTGGVKHSFSMSPYKITSEAFSPDSKTLATGRNDGTVLLRDVQWGKIKRTFTWHADDYTSGKLSLHKGSINGVAFSPDSKTLATGKSDGAILLWDIAPAALDTEELIEELTEDINDDGIVNIQDLLLVAVRIRQNIPAGGHPEDVNGDGVINIQDLVQVAGAIGN